MFLSMILAQVDAVVDDLPLEIQITRAARDSLQLCLGLLESRKDLLVVVQSPNDVELAAAGVDVGQGLANYGMDIDWDSLLQDMGWGS